MKMRTLFIANVVVQVLFGLGFLFTPALILGIFGTQTDATGLTPRPCCRRAHSQSCHYWLAGWLKMLPRVPCKTRIIFGFSFAHLLAGIQTLLAILCGTFNAIAWPVVVMDAFFTVAFLWGRGRI